MLYSSLLAVFAMVSFASAESITKRQSGNAAITINNINVITQMSTDLKVTVDSINLVNAIVQGPKVSSGFSAIVNSVNQDINSMKGFKAFGDADAKLIVAALRKFVTVHQQLLNAVIGKHGIATLIPFDGPITAALRSLEQVVDSFAFGLINLIPTQAPAATSQFSSLDKTIQLAITVYSGPV